MRLHAKGWIGLVSVAAVVGLVFVLRGKRQADPEPVPLEIGYATTRLVEPLTAAGHVDYAAALNAVEIPAPEDNAAIPLLRILGTEVLHPDEDEVLGALGAPEGLPATGTFVTKSDELPYFDAYTDLEEAEDKSAVRGWIESNRDALDALVVASERPRLWWPIRVFPGDRGLDYALGPDSLRTLTEALVIRADLRLADGRLQDGWKDTQGLLRLQGLMDQLRGSLSRLVAGSLQRWALDWLARALDSPSADEAFCTDVLETLLCIPTRRGLAPDLDRCDRYFVLGTYVRLVAGDIEKDGGDPCAHPAYAHVNRALREVNEAVDEIVPLLQAGTSESRKELERRIDERRAAVKRLAKDLRRPAGATVHLVRTMATGGAETGRRIGEVLASTLLALVPMVVTHIHESETRRSVAIVAAALRLHALRHGSYPASLDALVPAVLEALPRHPFDDAPIPFEVTDEGCRVGDEEWAIELK